LLVHPGRTATILYWRLLKGAGCTLAMCPLMSGRDYHSMHHENPGFNFTPKIVDGRVIFHPYNGVPGVAFHSMASFSHQPEWYRNFLYTEEQARGLDSIEDLASPGVFRWDLSKGEATMTIAVELGSALVEKRIRDAESSRRANSS